MKFAIICPGQGSQAVGMGKSFYDDFSYSRPLFELASDVLHRDIKKLLFEENADLSQSQWTQSAILLVSVIAYEILKKESDLLEMPMPFVLGHSLGELSSLCVAGAINIENALKLVFERGKMMQLCSNSLGEVGMMVVMGLSSEIIEDFVLNAQKKKKSIWVANYNNDAQIVLAGKRHDLKEAVDALKDLKAKRVLLLDMSVISHCPLLEEIVTPFRDLLEKYICEDFKISVVSNVTTQKYNSKKEAIELLGLQLISPVKYNQSIKSHAMEIDYFIECGHGAVLKGLNARITDKPTLNVSNTETLTKTLQILKEQK